MKTNKRLATSTVCKNIVKLICVYSITQNKNHLGASHTRVSNLRFFPLSFAVPWLLNELLGFKAV